MDLRTTFLLSLALPTILAGCVTYEPKPLDPRAELAALERRQPPAQPVVLQRLRPDAPDAPPFDISNGWSDAELMALAVTLNPELQAARASIGEAEALLVAANTLPNPEFGVGFGAGLPGTSGFKLDTALLFELLKPGERDARRAVASARIAMTRAQVLAKEYEIAAETRATEFTVLVAERSIEFLDAELELRKQAAELVDRRRSLGEANALDVSAVELDLVEVRRERRRAALELAEARLALNRILGLPSNCDIDLEESRKPLAIPLLDPAAADQLRERLLAHRLDLKAREAQYTVAEEELRLAVARQFAKLRVGPLYEHEGESDNYAGLDASIEIPIFDRNQGEIADRTAARDRVRAEYVADLHRLRSDAASALARVGAARAEIEAQERDVLPLLDRSQQLFRSAFEARELSVLDWVASQQRLLRTRRANFEAVVAYRRALLELESLGGFPAWRLAPEEITSPETSSIDRSNP